MPAQGKNNRKYGRNSSRGQAKMYAAEHRLEKNKERRRQRTMKRQPNNEQIRLESADARRNFDRKRRTEKRHERA
jgi:hypothetical protein